ncbi:HAMP domain-containing sensor histidine kinase [Streptomyces sp. NPDC093085]|uniref:sensor histidine kinase n=1 Tax=Streptomyces sp. NPDC093085 TaxID=3155068 RepID=UPI003428B16F
MRWPRRLRPRSLRSRLVLIASLLATSAVLLCQLAGLTVLRGWLTDQVDDRLARFRPPEPAYADILAAEAADIGTLRPGRPHDDVLPSDYRVYFYDAAGDLLDASLASGGSEEGPRLPRHAADLDSAVGKPRTVPDADDAAGRSGWRVMVHSGPDRMYAVVALPLDTVDGATTKLLWLSLSLGAAVAAGVVVLGNGAVRLGLRPLTRVEHTARHITEGALPDVPVADPDTEVGRLGLALNTMLDRLRAALQRREASEAQLRRFMADAGHELRTPLTAIQGFSELLLDEPDMSVRRRREAHALIAHNADRMSRLVEDLFLLAKLGDTPAAHRESVDLLSLAADAIATTAVRHPARPITLEPLTTHPTAPAPSPVPSPAPSPDLDVIEAPGDPHQLAQVLGNLLANACAHTPAATAVHVRVGATRTPQPGSGPAPGSLGSGPPLPPGTPVNVIEVADEGPGIDPAEAPRVFDRFYRATPLHRPSVRTRAYGADGDPDPDPGSGLGLAIAAAIATAHGGRLELDNRPGEGCVFRLLLPDPADGT